MNTNTLVVSLMSLVTSFIYGWLVLDFIKAPQYLWGFWGITIIIGIVTSTLTLKTIDDTYKEQFKKVIVSAKEELRREFQIT